MRSESRCALVSPPPFNYRTHHYKYYNTDARDYRSRRDFGSRKFSVCMGTFFKRRAHNRDRSGVFRRRSGDASASSSGRRTSVRFVVCTRTCRGIINQEELIDISQRPRFRRLLPPLFVYKRTHENRPPTRRPGFRCAPPPSPRPPP